MLMLEELLIKILKQHKRKKNILLKLLFILNSFSITKDVCIFRVMLQLMQI